MSAAEAPRVVKYPPPAHRFLTPGLIALYLAEDPAQSVLETGTDPGGGAIGTISPLNPTKVTFFTMILYNSENSVRDIRPI